MNEFVVIKLITGDLFMARILNETTDTLVVENPITVKTVQVKVDDQLIEKTVTNPFCTITPDKEYSFDKKHVLFSKSLHPSVRSFYQRLVEAFDEEYSELNEYLDAKQHLDEVGTKQEDDLDIDDSRLLVVPDKKYLH